MLSLKEIAVSSGEMLDCLRRYAGFLFHLPHAVLSRWKRESRPDAATGTGTCRICGTRLAEGERMCSGCGPIGW